MKDDPIQKFIALRESLVTERSSIATRLAQIDQALQPNGRASAANVATPAPVPRTRTKNRMSLREAVILATKAKPLTKPEILAAVKKLGYKIGGKKPLNSLNVALYSNNQFKNNGGRFSPAS